MSFNEQTTPRIPTDGERLVGIERDIKYLVEAFGKFVIDVNSKFEKADARSETLENKLADHQKEDGATYRSLKYKVIEYIVITILGLILLGVARSMGIVGI